CYYNKAENGLELYYKSEYDLKRADATYGSDSNSESVHGFKKCIHKSETSCLEFDRKEDCVNSSSPYSLQAEEQVGDFGFDFNQSNFLENIYYKEPVINVNHGFVLNTLGFKTPAIVSDSFKKLEGDNIPLAQSDDYFGFGKCQWHPVGAITLYSNGSTVKNTQGMCGKNSDNDPNMISAQTPPFDQYVEDLESMDFNTTNLDESNYTFYQVNQFIPDCGSNAVVSLNNYIVDSLKCRQDFTEPNTTIMNLEKIKGEFEIEVLIQDNSFDYSVFQPQIQQSSEGLEDDEITVPIPQINFMFNPYPKTYVCITDLVPTNADEDNFCYPNGTAKRITLNKNLITYENVGHKVLYNFSEKGFKSGMHRFHYFTEDISHNLEPVRTFDVLIDADAPNITFTSSNYSFEIFEDEWRTNLSLTMKSMNEPAICTANLTLNGYTVYPVEAVYDEYGEEWDLNFGYMIDNTYVFVYTCEDEVGNIAKGNLTIFIDGDQSITQPQPKGTINDSQVELKVYTGKSAECRFLENPDPNHDDLPGFEWNATANMNAQQKQEHIANLFPSMTPFETSVGDEPNTIHKHKLTLDPKSDSRFHQFYVKCLMGEKYRGNAGDEIRFALDLTAPTTITHEDVDVFQGWYNADLTVELECMDWPMYGVGFSWEYGCSADENTFFCLGENCDEYQNYLAYKTNGPIFLTEEGDNYISYFSMDKGNNKEVVVQNALFKLDKTPSNLTLEFWEGNIKEDILRPGIPYTIFLNSSKPLISPGIQLPKITYSSDPQNFVGTIELFPTNVTTIYTGFFHIPYINDNLDFEGDGKFVVSAKDFHNVPVEVEFSIPIDTKPPTQPVIEPEFEQYPEWDYPLRVHDGIYYTSEPTFHITGYTDELLDIIAVLNYQDGSSNGANNKNYTFTQSEDSATKMFYDDSIISAFGDYFEVRVNGDISDLTSSAHFVGFDSETETIGPRTEYGDYGKFYDMVSVDYMGGDNKYTEVMVYPALEESYPLNNEVFFYTREYPLFWYGFDLELKPYQLNQFYLKAYDPSGNLVRLPTTSDEPSVFSVFLDPDKPIVHEHFPMDGTTAQDSFDIQIYVTEDNSESGIDNESIVFSISGGNFLDETVPAQVERSFDLENSSDHPQFNGKKVYRIFYSVYDLEEATYEVEIYAEDLAGNILDENIASASWTFMVDKSAPIYPNFELVPGFPGLTISENSTPRWYSSQNNPEFSLEFFDDDPITITSVSLLSTPFSDNANCTESEDIFNFFNCKFFNNDVTDMNQTSQDYALNIEAFKTLADGTDSPRGIYGPFEFTIDSQAPDFEILNFKPRIRDDFNFTMNFDVDNEVHPLQVSITLTNANGETKEFDQYVTLPSSTGFYSFDWPVNIDWPDGNYSFSLTLKDFAGNYNTYNDYIYLDTTYPAFSIDLINVSNAFKIDNEWYTANSNVTITGTTDSDTYYIWVSPGDWNESTQAFAEKKAAVITKTNGVPSGFHVSVLLSGKLKEEVPNKFTIGVIDQAGNPNIKDFNIVQDLLEPATPSFYIST
ncbi:hypothetical protein HON01_01045, partial [Candidatus Woesearchaeota archaeon]|nr:hypothetical protein [Candidatus Woesearchaeota archaeon]